MMAIRAREADLLTVGEVARLLRVGGSTVRKWINEERVPYIELPGGDYRVPRVELFRSLRSNVDVGAVFASIEAKLASSDEDDIRREVHDVRTGRGARTR